MEVGFLGLRDIAPRRASDRARDRHGEGPMLVSETNQVIRDQGVAIARTIRTGGLRQSRLVEDLIEAKGGSVGLAPRSSSQQIRQAAGESTEEGTLKAHENSQETQGTAVAMLIHSVGRMGMGVRRR